MSNHTPLPALSPDHADLTAANLDRPGRLLLVDDDSVVRTLARRILEQVGHTVEAVSDPNQALRLFQQQPFDLVITDVNMPSKSGFELLDEVKAADQEIEFIMITGQPQIQEVLKAMRDDRVADFILKPFDHVWLRQTVVKVLRQRRIRELSEQLQYELRVQNQRQARQIELLSNLARVMSVISATLDEQEVMRKALHEARRLFDADWVLGLRHNGNADTLAVEHCLIGEQLDAPCMLVGTEVQRNLHPVLTDVWLPEKQMTAQRVSLPPESPFGQWMGRPSAAELLVAAIAPAGEPYGMLMLGRAETRPFSDEEYVALNLFLQHLGVALLNAELHAEVNVLATTDSLTGLLNRRELWRRAEAALAELDPQMGHAAVLMLDIDHFKGVNDTFGHTAGDKVLKAVGNVCRQSVRQFDLVGRYGGEEFMTVLINADHRTAERVANRIWKNISALELDWEGRPVRVTASVGVAISTPDVRLPLNRLVVEADEAQYQAKQSGRNRIVLAWAEAAGVN